MSSQPLDVLCPYCQTPIGPNDRFCSGCGVGIAAITLMLDQTAVVVETRVAPGDLAAKGLRLGEFLAHRNLITEPQLDQALKHQKELASRGESRMLGEIMVEVGTITRDGLERAIVDQVIALQTAPSDSNRRLEEQVAERTAELERPSPE